MKKHTWIWLALMNAISGGMNLSTWHYQKHLLSLIFGIILIGLSVALSVIGMKEKNDDE